MSTHDDGQPSKRTATRRRRNVPAAFWFGALGAAAAATVALRALRIRRFDPLDPDTWPADTLSYSG